jgi:hypothetical protein
MVFEGLIGLDGNPPILPRLYFPYLLLDLTAYFVRGKQIGDKECASRRDAQ